MKPIILKRQNGLALIMLVLMLMAVGGFVLVGYGQGLLEAVEVKKLKHNTRVLKEAKQALLQYAYNYPVNNPNRGPGRLPCPDTDNNGTPNPSFNCISGTAIVGRFPWNDTDMNFYDVRDSSGERLWYAVSRNFANQISPAASDVINSGTTGTITLVDQSQNIIYDGNGAGIAAVIIAPGPALVGQDRVADENDPANYLDSFNGFDNSVFNNGESDTNDDGFILGPVFDLAQNIDAINDQMIIITAAEVMELAVKAVLPFYPDEINKYQQAIWGGTVANYRYPWMNAYADISDLAIYDVVPGTTVGRVPFLNYYTDYDSHTVITDLIIDYDIDLVDTADGNDPGYINAFFTGTQLDISRSNLSFKKETFDLSFDNSTDNIGTLISRADGTTVVNSPSSFTQTLYFWDGCPSCPEPEDGWELCPVNFGNHEDCAKDGSSPYNFVTYDDDDGWGSYADIKLRVVQLQIDIDADFEIGLDYSIPPTGIDAPAAPTATLNSRRRVILDPASVTIAVDANSSIADTTDFINITVSICEQDNLVGSVVNLSILGNPDGNTALCFPAIDSSGTVNQLDITADYYPELPLWVSQNNWNDSILMTYADEYRPDGAGICTPEDGDPGSGATDDCIVVNNAGGINNNIVSLLLNAGENDFVDEGGDNFLNDLHDIFETENYSGIGAYPGLRLVFDKREDAVVGNSTDIIFIMDSL